MPDLTVVDSGPIISFARARKLHLIRKVCNEVIIPPAVYDEIMVRGKDKPGGEEIKGASWASVKIPKNQIEVAELLRQFDRGESEAMFLAAELKAVLLADERIITREARRRNIPVVSSHLILVEAKRTNLIKTVSKELDDLIAGGFRTSSEVIRQTLQKGGE